MELAAVFTRRNPADLKAIEKEIITMPDYFSDYDTAVHFISAEEFRKNHGEIAHGGFVFRSAYPVQIKKTAI